MKFIDLNNLKENLENFLNTVLLNIFPTKEEVQTNLDSKLSVEDINLFVPLQNDITRTVYGLKINISYLDTTENCKVTLNGKATNDIEFFIANSNIPFGNLSGGTSKCKIIEMYTDDNGMTQKNIDSGDGCTLKGKGNIYLSISNGTSFSNEVIYPKIMGDKNSIGKSLIINDSENYINKAMRTGFIEGDNNLGIMTYTPSDGSVFTNDYKDTVYPKLYSSFSLYSYMISQLQDENHTDYNIYNNHAEGKYTIARGDCQFVEGKYNIEDEDDKYAHIVGGGTSEDNRKNIHTLDWDGNAEFAGDVIATSSTGDKVSLLTTQKKNATYENYWNGTQKWIKLFTLSPAATNIGDSMKFIISSRNHYEEVSISVITNDASPTGIGIIDFTTNLKEGTSLIVAYHNKVENLIDVFYASEEAWDTSNFNIVHHITSDRIVCTVHNTDSTIPAETENYVKHLPTSKFVELDNRVSDNGYGEVAGGKNLFQSSNTFSGINSLFNLPINLKPNTTYTFSLHHSNDGGSVQIAITDDSNNQACDSTIVINFGKPSTESVTFSTNSIKATRIGLYSNVEQVISNIQVEEGTHATSYEPYYPSNKMLAEEKADKSETTVNLLNPTLENTTSNGVTCTDNGDGTYTLNGTATNANATFDLSFSCSLNSPVKLLGRPKNTGGVMIQTMYNGSWDDPTTWDTIGTGVILSDASKINRLSLFLLKDMSVKNAIFKPMITTNLDATYDDFVPYTGDSGKLNSDVADLKNDLSASNAGAHNSVYRGKYLGNAFTTEQKAQISAGTFNDLYIGDYWTIDGVNYRIAAFDYWLNSGDTTCTTHHVVIVPDSNLYTAKMNDTDITTGAYVGSAMYTVNLAAAKTTINNAFGSKNILSHREYLANATKSTTDPTYESSGSWYNSTVELMNERMVYGADVFHNIEVNGVIPTNYTIDKNQLPLFSLEPSRICNRADWWLRDVVSAASFAFVSLQGSASSLIASSYFGIRPVFGIKG